MLPEIFTNPTFYDKFGIFIFLYLGILSFLLIKKKIKIKKWMLWTILGISIVGLIVDGTLVSGVLKTLGVTG